MATAWKESLLFYAALLVGLAFLGAFPSSLLRLVDPIINPAHLPYALQQWVLAAAAAFLLLLSATLAKAGAFSKDGLFRVGDIWAALAVLVMLALHSVRVYHCSIAVATPFGSHVRPREYGAGLWLYMQPVPSAEEEKLEAIARQHAKYPSDVCDGHGYIMANKENPQMPFWYVAVYL